MNCLAKLDVFSNKTVFTYKMLAIAIKHAIAIKVHKEFIFLFVDLKCTFSVSLNYGSELKHSFCRVKP